jgi:hypothetical protein
MGLTRGEVVQPDGTLCSELEEVAMGAAGADAPAGVRRGAGAGLPGCSSRRDFPWAAAGAVRQPRPSAASSPEPLVPLDLGDRSAAAAKLPVMMSPPMGDLGLRAPGACSALAAAALPLALLLASVGASLQERAP